MGGNIPGESFLVGNFPRGNFSAGSLMGGNFPGGNFPRTYKYNYIKLHIEPVLFYTKTKTTVRWLPLSSAVFLSDCSCELISLESLSFSEKKVLSPECSDSTTKLINDRYVLD